MDDLYLYRPTPEYGHAFDLVGSRLEETEGPALAVLSSSAHLAEVLKRIQRPTDLAFPNGDDGLGPIIREWARHAVQVVDVAAPGPAYGAMTWAEPERGTHSALARRLRRLALPGASLDVIATSFLRRYLPAYRDRPCPAARPVPQATVLRALVESGWQVEEALAFHGPRSTGWSLLERAALALGRDDWADRCQAAARLSYRETGALRSLSPLALIRARAI